MFSVLIATFNGAKYIIEQLDSVVHQTVPPDKIYIYDDCSMDNTIEIISDWINENKIKNVVIRKNSENKGYTRNFLDALFEIDDDYIFLCDQDDVWRKNKIKEYKQVLDVLENQQFPLLLTSGYSISNEKLEVVKFVHVEKERCTEIQLNKFIKKCSYPGMTFCLNRALKNKISSFYNKEVVTYHDYFISLCALKYGKMLCIQDSLVFYRQHDKNQIGVSGKKKKSRSYWKKVLQQKCNENKMTSYLFSEIDYIVKKTKFGDKRLDLFVSQKIFAIICNFYNYLRFYDFKSYIADLYYLIFGDE